MTFAEKLDFLMKITHTTNSVLARSIAMDASFISRLRRGVRTPARNVNYIRAMAVHLGRNCSADYQKTALFEAVKSTSKIQPQEFETPTELIQQWLTEETLVADHSIEDFLEGVAHFQFKKTGPVVIDYDDGLICRNTSDGQAFYGMEGKQNAVIIFLSLVLKNENPQTLFLFSDEDMEWLTINPEFTAKWAVLLAQVMKNGNKIKIIHTVNRGFDEMLSAIKHWVPIYMTGSIEPYYYPKTRDGLFRRTLFIAPETAAVSSSSVANKTKKAANFLYTDKNKIRALLEEYYDFMAFCRPLMRIFTSNNRKEYLPLLNEFEGEGANTVIKTDGLANITMPGDVVRSILTRAGNADQEQLLDYQHRRGKQFIEGLQKCRFIEVIPRPDPEKIKSGREVINFSDLLGESLLFYSPMEYSQHLREVIRLLKTYENYRVHMVGGTDTESSMLYVKEDVGVLIGKSSPPSVIFALNESNMSAAFWDYMNAFINKGSGGRFNRNHTIAELEAIAGSLEHV